MGLTLFLIHIIGSGLFRCKGVIANEMLLESFFVFKYPHINLLCIICQFLTVNLFTRLRELLIRSI